MTISSKPPVRGSAACVARADLIQRLFPSILYELTQISTAVTLEIAAATRWRSSNVCDLEEVRTAEDRLRAQLARADAFIRTVTALGQAEIPGPAASNLARIAELAVAISRDALYQLGSVVRIAFADEPPRVHADCVAVLHFLLELILDAGRENSEILIEIAVQFDQQNVILSVAMPLTRSARPYEPESDLYVLAETAGGRLYRYEEGETLMLSFPIDHSSPSDPGPGDGYCHLSEEALTGCVL